ncbi:protein SNORC [Sphaeramia orbicularis]|uniref:protein SNORC n=1 Tax=Sphaeramia orbicularis TaxID=375764 RepID=UPI00117E370C|nr:protein SNORC [Sphaeramia orbicularis]
MMCSQSPQCPDGPAECSPSPTLSPSPQSPTFPPTPGLFSCSSPGVRYLSEATARLSFGDTLLFFAASSTMVHHCSSNSICRVVLLGLLGLLFAFVSTETVADPALTSRDNQDTMSGEMPSDVTTKDPFHDLTEHSFTYDYEDATHTQTIDEEEGVLGPGAITAIVIAVFLGASVLLALIVITLRKFTAS